MTAPSVLIDTNVLVYAYDPADQRKQDRALAVLGALAGNNRGRVSAQVLGEFSHVVTRRLTPPLRPAEARGQVAELAQAWPVLPVTAMVVLEAVRGVLQHGLPYWDAQVWATARLNQIPVVLSEDFSDGRVLEGVAFRDPFARGFDLAALG
jgi:predicted nucleic acid-binding protein